MCEAGQMQLPDFCLQTGEVGLDFFKEVTIRRWHVREFYPDIDEIFKVPSGWCDLIVISIDGVWFRQNHQAK